MSLVQDFSNLTIKIPSQLRRMEAYLWDRRQTQKLQPLAYRACDYEFPLL